MQPYINTGYFVSYNVGEAIIAQMALGTVNGKN